MSQTVITILLAIALVLPFLGALVLRMFRTVLPPNVAECLVPLSLRSW
jgi:hypothetical protein